MKPGTKIKNTPTKALFDAIRLPPRELFTWDFFFGITTGIAGAYLSFIREEPNQGLNNALIGIVGVVLGAIIGAVAIVSAFMDSEFIRKIHAIDREPVFFLRPFIFTAALSTMSLILLVSTLFLPENAPRLITVPLTFLSTATAGWTLGAIFPLLGTLVAFLDLKSEAAKVPDHLGD